MAELQSFSTPSGREVWFEVEASGGGSPNLAEALEQIAALGGAVVDSLTAMGDESGPDEIETVFGLVADGSRLAVSRGLGSANLRVTLRWSAGAPEIPGSDEDF